MRTEEEDEETSFAGSFRDPTSAFHDLLEAPLDTAPPADGAELAMDIDAVNGVVHADDESARSNDEPAGSSDDVALSVSVRRTYALDISNIMPLIRCYRRVWKQTR